MAYTKHVVVAQNSVSGSYAAGCPASDRSGSSWCVNCERTE